jgi:hypothetical protein
MEISEKKYFVPVKKQCDECYGMGIINVKLAEVNHGTVSVEEYDNNHRSIGKRVMGQLNFIQALVLNFNRDTLIEFGDRCFKCNGKKFIYSV